MSRRIPIVVLSTLAFLLCNGWLGQADESKATANKKSEARKSPCEYPFRIVVPEDIPAVVVEHAREKDPRVQPKRRVTLAAVRYQQGHFAGWQNYIGLVMVFDSKLSLPEARLVPQTNDGFFVRGTQDGFRDAETAVKQMIADGASVGTVLAACRSAELKTGTESSRSSP